jgi:hypothetical protein
MRKICAAIVLFLVATLPPSYAQSKPPVTPPRLISLPVPDCRAGKPCHGSQENGKSGDIRAELGDAVLVDAATAAAQQAQFVPGSFFGKPTAMDYVLTLHF